LKKEFTKYDKQHQKWLEQQNKKKEEGKGEDNKEEEKLE